MYGYYEWKVLCVDVKHSDKSHFSQGYKIFLTCMRMDEGEG